MIAQELGISESTVKTHLKRVMRILRKQMLLIIFSF
ncbi:LuxR C-terminal-related transcriptional regulator [Duncaniella freteri]